MTQNQVQPLILALDQGTTSSRAIAFSSAGDELFNAQQDFEQHYPHNGWVEHNPNDLWQSTLHTAKTVMQQASNAGHEILALGITNQRETTLIWHRETGECLYNAIVWQDRRTAEQCTQLKTTIDERALQHDTGLLLDPYFCATKIAWILDNVTHARTLAEQGKLAFGTVDCYLIWQLTGGKVHATDASNASRSLLFNIHTQSWDDRWLEVFNIPSSLLPEVKDSADDFGVTDKTHFGIELPIRGVAGDQQAALIGQVCFEPGMIKSTYGTGCFMMLNTGTNCLQSNHRLLSTVAYRIKGETTYAIEGAIFIAGAAIQWLRDGIGLIERAEDTEPLSKQLNDEHGVYLVPAFTGLGAPYWNPNARGALFGLTRDTQIAHIARATLESVAYQTQDLIDAMRADNANITDLRVDGGMVHNQWFLQSLANITDLPITRPQCIETTALGAAYLAGLGVGLYDSLNDLAQHWQTHNTYTPNLKPEVRQRMLRGWKHAVNKVND